MTRESATSTSSKSSRYSWRALFTTHAFDLLDDLAIFSRRSLSSGVIRIARVSLADIIHLPVAIQCNTMQLYAGRSCVQGTPASRCCWLHLPPFPQASVIPAELCHSPRAFPSNAPEYVSPIRGVLLRGALGAGGNPRLRSRC